VWLRTACFYGTMLLQWMIGCGSFKVNQFPQSQTVDMSLCRLVLPGVTDVRYVYLSDFKVTERIKYFII